MCHHCSWSITAATRSRANGGLRVESGVLALRGGLLETLLERAAAGLYTCGGQRSLLLRQREDEWSIAEAEVAAP